MLEVIYPSAAHECFIMSTGETCPAKINGDQSDPSPRHPQRILLFSWRVPGMPFRNDKPDKHISRDKSVMRWRTDSFSRLGASGSKTPETTTFFLLSVEARLVA